MTPSFDAATAEETIAAFVTGGADARALLTLLPEQHPLYAGRSTNATARIRGFVLAAFEKTGLPERALPYVLEELESGRDAYLVAAAARALRGTAPDARFVPLLEKARQNIRYLDAPVTFDVYKPRWPVANATNASQEIGKTLAWLEASPSAADAACCDVSSPPDRARKRMDLDARFEDQDGRFVSFREFFRGKWSVVAFFYSRCDNPEKCSLTIARLARLQDEIARGSLRGRVRIAAITYDPAYDLPERMKQFGENRGIRFDDDVRFLRAPDALDELRARFDLGVNYIGPIVNRHRIELYVLDPRANVVATFSRMQLDVSAIVAELERLASKKSWRAALVPLPAILLAFLPKCPLCIGAYLTAAGVGGLQFLAQRTWTIPIALALLLAHVTLVYRRSRRTRSTLALIFALAGAITLLTSIAIAGVPLLAAAGALLIGVSSLLQARR